LELAAKAAGLNGLWVERVIDWDSPHHNCSAIQLGSCSAETWNPLTDDGDALRLAVKLGLYVEVGKGGIEEISVTAWDGMEWNSLMKYGSRLVTTPMQPQDAPLSVLLRL